MKIMGYKVCPKCELNYILDNEEYCQSCQESMQSQKLHRPGQHRTKRTVPQKNIAFKCNFCNGGEHVNGVGFSGICSDELLQYNVANKVWCGSNECLCKKYINGDISRDELESEYKENNRCVCYESHLLVNWEMAAGFVVRGINQGKPNKLLGVRTNSLCVLTTKLPNARPEERYIFAVFIVKRGDEGDDTNAGLVIADDKYRISLTLDEAQKMSFWKYYQNNSDKAPMQWGTGLFRYLNDGASVAILKDIIKIKNNNLEKKQAEDFLHYFISINEFKM